MKLKSFAIVTMVRNEAFFLPKWISYYGGIFGFENLYVVFDGFGQARPNCEGADQVNYVSIPHKSEPLAQGDRTRANFISHFSTSLFRYYGGVIFTDSDEFLVLDPNTKTDLVTYLSGVKTRVSIAALGIDVIHDRANEPELDPIRPYLEQRHFGQINSIYTKPSTLFRPTRHGGGGHRLKYHPSRIDPNLYLFHFGLVDYQQSLKKLELNLQGRSGEFRESYLKSRQSQFADFAGIPIQDGDKALPAARHSQMWKRDWKRPLNPGKMNTVPRISIPKRFRPLV